MKIWQVLVFTVALLVAMGLMLEACVAYVQIVDAAAPRLWPAQEMVKAEVERLAARAGIPAEFALRVAWRESGFAPGARGALGEVGPMQVNPAARPEVRYLDWRGQAAVGVALLRVWLDRCHGDWVCAESSYRAGHLVRGM